jgi:protein-S-isoprenylcysteine O-methyltransferase Ste14
MNASMNASIMEIVRGVCVLALAGWIAPLGLAGPGMTDPGSLGVAIRGVAATFMAIGSALALASLRTMQRWGFRSEGGVRGGGPTHLVVQGSYRFVRNPFLVGIGLVVVGHQVRAPSVPLAAFALACAALARVMIVPREESRLGRRFGRPYAAYLDAIGRWLPSTRRRRAFAFLATILHP